MEGEIGSEKEKVPVVSEDTAEESKEETLSLETELIRKEVNLVLQDVLRELEETEEQEGEKPAPKGEGENLTIPDEDQDQGKRKFTFKLADAVDSLIELDPEGRSSPSNETIWDKHREKIKAAGRGRILRMLPFNYFLKLANRLSQRRPSEDLESEETKELPKKETQPIFARLFSRSPARDQRRKSSALGPPPTDMIRPRLSSIISESAMNIPPKETAEESSESVIQSISVSSPTVVSSRSARSSGEERKEEPVKGRITKKLQCDSIYNYAGVSSNVWNMGQRISHWRLAHNRGYQVDQLTQDKYYKHKLMQHERDIKTSVPLPLQELIEEEVVNILMDTWTDYKEKLGLEHPMTLQIEEQVNKLNVQLQARGEIGVESLHRSSAFRTQVPYF